jgi:hypothetical protein
MPVLYSIWAVVLLLATPAMAQQPQPQPSPIVTTGYMVFLKGTLIGREELTVTEDTNGLTLTGQSRLAAPLKRIVEIVRKRGLMVLISDLLAPLETLEKNLSMVSRPDYGVPGTCLNFN